ncbi:PIN domain-containing protein [Bacteroidia bacterium]|nr:PIN domain-containing protein [Bacteroidia bacterium]
MMTKILIDSDVILDFFLDQTPFSVDAAKIFSLSETKKIECYTTPLIISNVYYILCKIVKHEKAIDLIKSLLLIVDIVMIDKKVVIHALNSSFKDFEDALQNYSAELNSAIKIIITRNTKDYKYSLLSVLSPSDFLSADALYKD